MVEKKIERGKHTTGHSENIKYNITTETFIQIYIVINLSTFFLFVRLIANGNCGIFFHETLNS